MLFGLNFDLGRDHSIDEKPKKKTTVFEDQPGRLTLWKLLQICLWDPLGLLQTAANSTTHFACNSYIVSTPNRDT